MAGQDKSPILELFVFETIQLLEQLECLILDGEKSGGLESAINEVFRIMHTIKGSAAMMLYNDISSLAHTVEDVFYYLREGKPADVNYSELTDLVLQVVDFTKEEVEKVKNGSQPDQDSGELKEQIKSFLVVLKGGGNGADSVPKAAPQEAQPKYYIDARKPVGDTDKTMYEAHIFFDEDCEMENIRAFTLIHELGEFAEDIEYQPADVLENGDTAELIRHDGFKVIFATRNSLETMQQFFAKTMFLRDITISVLSVATEVVVKQKKTIDLDGPMPTADEAKTTTATTNDANTVVAPAVAKQPPAGAAEAASSLPSSAKATLISVNVAKMDLIMDLVGELVIAEAMVTQNPELQGLHLDKFHKAARQLRKITDELQDTVMSVRMVELTTTFQKMNRIVRDMTKKLNKQAELEIIGEQTEVDKNIIEQLSDPLMHLIRNSLDHGIEPTEERVAKGKSPVGKIRLEAKNAGGDVLIIIQDDGGGLNKEKILNKARERGLVQKDESTLTDKEIFAFILQPGFSTKDAVTEFSGRGVGMDVVSKNLEKVRGKVSVDSVPGMGTTMSIRIPLTLAIVDGMNVKVGNAIYTIPTLAIRESFRVRGHNVIKDTEDNEMIMIRGECYPIIRLNEQFGIEAQTEDINEGIMVMVEDGGKSLCLFADALIGQQQVVVKGLPSYIKKRKGIAGCTLLGDGSISLILDVGGLVCA